MVSLPAGLLDWSFYNITYLVRQAERPGAWNDAACLRKDILEKYRTFIIMLKCIAAVFKYSAWGRLLLVFFTKRPTYEVHNCLWKEVSLGLCLVFVDSALSENS